MLKDPPLSRARLGPPGAPMRLRRLHGSPCRLQPSVAACVAKQLTLKVRTSQPGANSQIHPRSRSDGKSLRAAAERLAFVATKHVAATSVPPPRLVRAAGHGPPQRRRARSRSSAAAHPSRSSDDAKLLLEADEQREVLLGEVLLEKLLERVD
mmetsp:Transcript_62276/g.165239  ORF Transcript_62276/g.165239 Transcript_62276/m.165239 type:complete len:153 (-) Transcript_62276:1860-2318(-)